MTETYPINQSHSNINKSSYKQSCDNHHKKGLSSSSLDSLFENKKYERNLSQKSISFEH